MFSHLTVAADPSLGRFDFDSLSDQTRMELLIGDLKETLRYKILTDDGDFKDVCDWEGVQCNSAGNVTQVEMISHASPENGETLNLVYMPPLITNFAFAMVGASGSIDTQALPAGLKILYVTQTERMSGPIETKHLPRGLTELDLELNAFDGGFDLTVLPPALEWLNVHSNNFSGSVNLSRLPAMLKTLYLGANQLSGELDFSSLTDSIEDIGVLENNFAGSFRLTNPPPELWRIKASGCASITGTAVVDKSFVGHLWMYDTGVTAVTDGDGKAHAMELQFLKYDEDAWDDAEVAGEYNAFRE